MLNIPEGLKEEFLTDSVKKDIVIPFTDANTDVSGVNWYTGFVAYGIQVTSLTPGKDVILFCNYDGTNWDTQLNDYVYQNYLDKAEYIYVSAKLSISAYTDLPDKIYLAAHHSSGGTGYGGYYYWFNPNNYLTELMGDGLRIYTRIPASRVSDANFKFTQLALYCPDATTINMTYGLGDIQVESSNVDYAVSDLFKHTGSTPALPYLGESIIRQGLDPLDYITIGKDPINNITNDDIEFQSFRLQENLCSSDNLKFGACEASYVNFTIYDRNENFKDRQISPFITTDKDDIQASIPLGTYIISEIKKTQTHNKTKIEITAFDKLTMLEQNAANWYTLYMYALSTDDYNVNKGFEFTRQIYSSYFNIMKYLGIENRKNYDETVLQNHSDYWNDVQNAYYNNGHKDLTYEVASGRFSTVKYGKYSVANADTDVSKPYVVDLGNYNNMSDADLKALALDYKQFIDEECRGIIGIANVLVVETLQLSDNITSEHSFVVDSGDYFMLSPNCVSFDIYFPWCFDNELNDQGGPYISVTGSVVISRVEKNIDLANAAMRLLYYDMQNRTIFECDTSISARDIVRSLLEVCGCFFKLDRYGMPTFLYPTMNALYPSNTLYPDDDLYPRGLDGSLLSMGRYTSFEYEDYQVQNIGRIQIVRDAQTNEVGSICEWEYEGDPDAINTYIIDDNVFFCNKGLIYDYDNTDDVGVILINMFNRISNMRYHPHLTQAIGMPWVEVGDRIGLLTINNGIESFIYRRTLKGVQVLTDTYEAHGNEYTEKVKDYNYTLWEG